METLQQLFEEAAEELYAYQSALENTLYDGYSKVELGGKILKLEELQHRLEQLAKFVEQTD